MEWMTEKPTEPGFYWATDGSPLLVLLIVGLDGVVIEENYTWQMAWANGEHIPVVLPKAPEFKWWCKLPVPPKVWDDHDEL